MELKLYRFYKGTDYTIGKLYIDGIFFCHTLEDVDRNLYQGMSLREIQDKKIAGRTAIPRGRYRVRMNRVSPKYSRRKFYKEFCEGKVPYIEAVTGFSGILIHIGNDAEDSAGCILVGENSQTGKVLNSTLTFKRLYSILKEYDSRGEEIWITID